MTKHQLSILAAMLCISSPSHAIPILSVTAAPRAVEVGSSVEVDVSIEDLDGELIGDYDIGLTFDESILSFGGVTFGTALGHPDDSLTGIETGAGSVEISEVSLLWFFTEQDGFAPVSLFTVAFDVIGAGTSPLSLYVNDIGNEWGDPLNVLLDNNSSTSVTGTVPPVSVPEPSTVVLLALGLLGVPFFRCSRGG